MRHLKKRKSVQHNNKPRTIRILLKEIIISFRLVINEKITEKNRQRNIVNKKGVNFEHALQNGNCLISGSAGQVATEDLNKLKRISSILNLRFGNFS